MNCREFMIQDLAYYNHRELPGKYCNAGTVNLLKSIFTFIPIINTIFGIVMIAKYEARNKHMLLNGMPQDQNRVPRIIAMSLCIASLGILLLPLMIMGTMAKNGRENLTLTGRKIKEVLPDYLL